MTVVCSGRHDACLQGAVILWGEVKGQQDVTFQSHICKINPSSQKRTFYFCVFI